jgi:hypothetical protein
MACLLTQKLIATSGLRLQCYYRCVTSSVSDRVQVCGSNATFRIDPLFSRAAQIGLVAWNKPTSTVRRTRAARLHTQGYVAWQQHGGGGCRWPRPPPQGLPRAPTTPAAVCDVISVAAEIMLSGHHLKVRPCSNSACSAWMGFTQCQAV